MALHREAGEPQCGRPALGTAPERIHLVIAQAQVELAAQLAGLVAIEGEVGASQLGKRAAHPQPLDRDRRVGSSRQHEMAPRGA